MGDDRMKVSIIIPHYNQRDCLQRLFPTLVSQTYKDFEVIVIDDCTPDVATVAYVKEYIKDKPFMQLVQNEVNLRFIKTCNKGIRIARGEYICLLNSDTVLRDNFVQRNVEILDADPGIGGLTCSIVDQHGRNCFTGGRYRHGIPTNLLDDFQGIRTSDFIAGTAVFYRKDVFDRIGTFDDNFIMYHEDIEFGLRVKKHTRYRVCTFSDKLVTHVMVPSIPRSEVWYYSSRNIVLLAKEYAPSSMPKVMAYLLIYFMVSPVVRALLAKLPVRLRFSPARISFAIASIRGVFDGFLIKWTRP